MKSKVVIRILIFSVLIFSGSMAHADQSESAKYTSVSAYILNPFISPDWIAESDLNSTLFGDSVASAGDVNGDGFADVIVGAPSFKNGEDMEGRAYVYLGSSTGLNPLPAWTFESNLVECNLGRSVASAGDVNGDGYDDVMVGSEFCGVVDREGRVYLFLGSAGGLSSTPDWMIQGSGSEESLGWSIASAGDVNNDGYDDVIIGAPWASYPEGHEGRAYVFYGSSTGLAMTADWITESNVAWSDFGSSVASAGDVNGDGYSDVIIGHQGMSNPENWEGRAYVYLGSASGLAASPAWLFENNLAGSWLGESVASAGDINGDGYSDVVLGGYQYSNPETREGGVYLFLGSNSGLGLTPAWKSECNQDYAEFGHSAVSAGDVNDDGYDDLLVGAPWYSDGENYEGRAFLYYGSPTGLNAAPVHTAESNQADAHLGYSVASAGDINGDGIVDMIIGTPWFDGGQENEGRVYAYHGKKDAEHVIFSPLILR